MATVDLSTLQSPASSGTTVVMPEGDEITLRPLMALGSEHDQLILNVITAVSSLNADGQVSTEKLGELMPYVSKLLAAAAPTKKAGERIDKLPIMARFQVLMGYVEDQDLGGFTPSED